MEWLERRLDERLDPAVYLPDARSILCVADRYHDGARDRTIPTIPSERIARYARGRDYHKVLKRRLVDPGQGSATRIRITTSDPASTRRAARTRHAQRAGLGLVGKHTLLIEPGVGSWMLLGAIVTTLPLTPRPASFSRADPCGSCTRCIDACPTDAITPFRVDATRCIAYTTIEHRGDVDASVAAATGDWLFGCDVCQEVCPHNQRSRRRPSPAVNEAYRSERADLPLAEILDWSSEDRDRILRGSAARRATLDMWSRNALVCIANVWRDDPGSVTSQLLSVRRIAQDQGEMPIVREAAQSCSGGRGVLDAD